MRGPQIYLDAAELIETRQEQWACIAIAVAAKERRQSYNPPTSYTGFFYMTFYPQAECDNMEYVGLAFFGYCHEENLAHRVLALCFAAVCCNEDFDA